MDNLFYERGAKLRAWKKTDNYKMLVRQQQTECDRLLKQGYLQVQNIQHIREDAAKQTVTVQFAAKGSVHRGVYCPSPVYDLFVGNVSRGRILKRVTARSRPSHRFGLDAKGRPVFADTFLMDSESPFSTEYILYCDNAVIGIAVNADDLLCAVSEEIYHGSKLRSYTYAQLVPSVGESLCFELYKEEYSYDTQGLAICRCTEYDPVIESVRQKTLYTFQRSDGFLQSYTSYDEIWAQIDPVGTKAIEYAVRFPRKA